MDTAWIKRLTGFLKQIVSFKGSRLSRRLLLYIVLCSSFFTLLATAFQLYMYYKTDVSAIHENIRFIRAGYQGPLAANAYNMDYDQLRLLLKGVLKFRDIEYLEIREPLLNGMEVLAQEGDPNARRDIVYEIPLDYPAATQRAPRNAILYIAASLEGVYKRLLDKFLVVLGSNAVKTFMASLLIFLIIQHVITRHLVMISNYANEFNLNKQTGPLILKRSEARASHGDELGQLVASVNHMRERLIQDINERKKLQAQLSSALEMARLGHWEYDVTRDIFTFTDHFYKIFRTSAKEVGGYTISSAEYIRRFVYPDDAAFVEEQIRKAIEGTDPEFKSQLEHRIIYADGSVGHVSVQFFIVKDAQGRTVKTYGVNQDITELKRTEEALFESEAKYRTVVESSLVGVYIVQDDLLRFVNKRWCEIYGYTYDEAVDKLNLIIDLTPPEDRKIVKENFRKRLTGEVYSIEYTTKAVKKNGEIIIVKVLGCSMVYKGRPAVSGTVIDVTESTLNAKALEESEAKMRSILDNIEIGIALISPKMEVLELNRRMRKWFPAINQGQHPICYRAFNDPPRETMCDYCPTFKTLQDALVHEATTQTPKAGGVRNYRIISSPIVNPSGVITAAIEIVEDITEKLSLESRLRRAQKMESIGTLAGGIAHEFNNILGIIMGNVELAITDVSEGNPARQNLEEIQIASLRARDMVRELLAFSRTSKEELKPLRLSPVVKEALKLIRSTIPSTIEIREDISEASDMVMANSTQINQIIINLCANAAHAMREEGGILSVRLEGFEMSSNDMVCYPDLKCKRYIRLTVGDTGCGITHETAQRIFDPFFTTKEVGQGTGMGLSVVHGIIKDHGGAVSVHSEPGKGTIFQVLFPAIEFIEEAKEKSLEPIPRGTEKILFVDDEQTLVFAAKGNLEAFGYNVVGRTNPLEILEIFRAQPDNFDLLISDVTMPGMTGDRLAAEIMKIRPNIPIILCTGYSDLVSKEKAEKMGIKAFVMKPIQASEMANTIRQVLDKTVRKESSKLK